MIMPSLSVYEVIVFVVSLRGPEVFLVPQKKVTIASAAEAAARS